MYFAESVFHSTCYFCFHFPAGEFRTSFVEIDFEDLGGVFTYTATITVGDRKSSATATVVVNIINENEAPRFTKNHFVIEADEGGVRMIFYCHI